MQDWQYGKMLIYPRGVHLGIIGGGVLPGSPNPDPILDQKVSEKNGMSKFIFCPQRPPSPTPLHFLFFSAAADLNKNHSASASSFTSKHERSRKRTVTSYLI